MNITKEVKQDLIIAMLAQASKRQAAATTKAARTLDKLWRQLFIQQIKMKIPEVPQPRWAELIQEGIFNSLKGTAEVVTYRNAKRTEMVNTPAGQVSMTYAGGGCNCKQREKDKEKWSVVRQAVESEWGGFLNFTTKYTGHYDFHYAWKTRHADLPSVPGLDRIYHPDVEVKKADQHRVPYFNEAYKLALESERLIKAYFEVLKAAGQMYEDLTTILVPIKTLKHLEAQFPDAVHYLPAEFLDKAPNVKQLADPKLVQRASALLLTGLPD